MQLYSIVCYFTVFLVILSFTCIAPMPSVDIVQYCYRHLFIYLQMSIFCLFLNHSHDFNLPLQSMHTISICIPNQCTVSSLYPDIPLALLLYSISLFVHQYSQISKDPIFVGTFPFSQPSSFQEDRMSLSTFFC